jgi:hypothetical protein
MIFFDPKVANCVLAVVDNFGVSDGHSESHQWQSPSEKNRGNMVSSDADHQDWLWMRARTSASVTGTNQPPESPFR